MVCSTLLVQGVVQAQESELNAVFEFIETCKFSDNSPIWKLTNLFTLLVELHQAIIVKKLNIEPVVVCRNLVKFHEQVAQLPKANASGNSTQNDEYLQYWKASKTAANDKHSRVIRAEVLSNLIANCVVTAKARKRREKKITKKPS